MTSLKISESARRNGAKSRGPKTPDGRARSSLNALKHGLTAKTLVLQNENSDQFAELLEAYLDYFRPQNQAEYDLLADLVSTRWRLRRIRRYETAMLDIEMDIEASDFEKKFEEFDEDVRGAEAFSNLANRTTSLSTTLQFDRHFSNTFRKTLDQLRRHQAERKNEKSENEPANPPKMELNSEK